MFTDPDYRRMGIAKELLHRVVEEAREYGCGTIQITASDLGVKLYTDYRFVNNDNFMQYKLLRKQCKFVKETNYENADIKWLSKNQGGYFQSY